MLVAYAAHALRNPLHSIHGCADLLQDAVAGVHAFAAHAGDLRTIVSECQSMERILNDFADLNAVRTSRLALCMSEVDLHAVPKALAYLHRAFTTVPTHWSVANDAPLSSHTDRLRLLQVLSAGAWSGSLPARNCLQSFRIKRELSCRIIKCVRCCKARLRAHQRDSRNG